jgi:MoaA/NifB/PqqE/SkfB family radical SAM enzyme
MAGLANLLRLVPSGGPAVCNVSVTNVCNATCSFCNFAHDKGLVTHRSWLDADRFGEALQLLYTKADVRFLTFMGGEPLLHPKIFAMADAAKRAGINPTMVTNGWQLPGKVDAIAESGISTLFISIDSADPAVHERNRGLKGVCERIRAATGRLVERGVTPVASVVMSKLVTDYPALGRFLRELGFKAVTFSYPRADAYGSSSMVYSDSDLVAVNNEDLIKSFAAADAIRDIIPVQNPRASMADMVRRLRGEPERFVCHAGYKYFYLDWNYDLWRCEAWNKPMCKLWDFEPEKRVRDGCQACMTDCYRDASVMLQLAVAVGDAFKRMGEGRPVAAAAAIANRQTAASLGAVVDQGGHLSGLTGIGRKRPKPVVEAPAAV